MRFPLSPALAAALLLAGTAPANAAPPQPAAKADVTTRGSLAAIEPLGTLGLDQAREIASGYPGKLAIQREVALYRLTYWTRLRGRALIASGLVGVPKDIARPKGVVAYLHGTNVTRAFAPSQPERIDGDHEAAVFATQGFLVILPDYIGLGESRERHPYLLTEPQVDASIDMLRAVHTAAPRLGIEWSPRLMMFGFSQGGQVVAGLHRELERRPLPGYRLAGSAGIAGPYDLRHTSRAKVLENECLFCVGYLAWAADAYAAHYGRRLDSLLQTDAARAVPALFDGSKRVEQIAPHLPRSPEALLRPEVLTMLRTDRNMWFTRALDRNETYRWAPRAPFRAYYGDKDTDVAPAASLAFHRYARVRGGKVSLHSVGPVDHMESARLAYPEILRWFEELAGPG